MADYYYVNIYNEGPLPWLNQNGPLFLYRLPTGILEIMLKDKRLKIEILKTPTQGQEGKERYLREKEERSKKIIINEVPPINEETPVITEPSIMETKTLDFVVAINENDVEEDPVDSEIDNALEDDDFDFETTNTSAVLTQDMIEEAKANKIYSDDELSTMTKSQMKKILSARGYKQGPYAGKYHDTVEMLKNKIRKTQTEK